MVEYISSTSLESHSKPVYSSNPTSVQNSHSKPDENLYPIPDFRSHTKPVHKSYPALVQNSYSKPVNSSYLTPNQSNLQQFRTHIQNQLIVNIPHRFQVIIPNQFIVPIPHQFRTHIQNQFIVPTLNDIFKTFLEFISPTR